MSIEQSILSNLVSNEEYFLQAFPHLKSEYFPRGPIRHIFDLISSHYKEFKTIPTKNAMNIALDKKSGISQVEFEETKEGIKELHSVPEDLGWILTESEKYCQDRAMYNALSESIRIQENAEKPRDEQDSRIPDKGYIQDLMKEALSVCFNTSIGHDYWDEAARRFQSYKTKARKIPFMTKILNTITKGGAEYKTLNLLLAGVNVGKSLGLCHLAAEYMLQGHDVLYISMEMSEEVVGKRIDANILDISMDELDEGLMTEGDFMRRVNAKQSKCGRLIVRQYPTGGANVNHFNNLMHELQMKRKFKPTIVIVDYLGIMASSRMKFSENSYTMVKAIAEELRGFAIEHNVCVWSAAQTNRAGWDNMDVAMGDIAESAGLAATSDFILAVMESPELADLQQQKFKQIKSRYGDKNKFATFILGVIKEKQRWIEVEVMGGDGVEKANERQNEQYRDNMTNRQKMAALAASTSVDDDIDWG